MNHVFSFLLGVAISLILFGSLLLRAAALEQRIKALEENFRQARAAIGSLEQRKEEKP